MAEAKVSTKKKQRRSVPAGQLHIQATFNNTIITFTDKKGNVLTASSAGACGFRGSKKGTAYASQVAAEKAAEAARSQYGVKAVDVFVKGVGLGRDAAIRAVGGGGLGVGDASANAAGHLQAGFGAGDVEEAGAVGVANLHVVNGGRSGFAGQVGGVGAGGNHQAGGGAEQRLHIHFAVSKKIGGNLSCR